MFQLSQFAASLLHGNTVRLVFSRVASVNVRPISTSLVLKFGDRRKREPVPVPAWANYDGNQLCEDDSKSNKLIWEGYKRNHKGQLAPKKTRLRCKRGEKLCGNPCPICSRNITIQHTDSSLLSQFICPHSGRILQATKTGLCRRQQKFLENAIEMARDEGHLPFTVIHKYPRSDQRTPPWNRVDIRN